ncbi:MAG: class I SAM-dependent methyltransferase, partial [Euzebyales bacterium]|nr:class I SAM-dependent methyltransferase [Euzebyales bacterium]
MTLPEEVRAYYAGGPEVSRITEGDARLELLRTEQLLRRHLPPPPARVLDVGGATGVHARWLAGGGYTVHVVDPVASHVAQAGDLAGVTAAVGDARMGSGRAGRWRGRGAAARSPVPPHRAQRPGAGHGGGA